MDVQRAKRPSRVSLRYGTWEDPDLDAWREQVDHARKEPPAQTLAQESTEAYTEFLDSLSVYYREVTRADERDL